VLKQDVMLLQGVCRGDISYTGGIADEGDGSSTRETGLREV